jgi:hypothetical protein
VRQKGFAQILVIIILFILIGAGAYYFGTKKGGVLPTPMEAPPSTTTTTTVSLTTDPTANWKTYVIAQEKITFKYPNNWIISFVEDQSQTILTSPNNFQLNFRTGIDGLGGGCPTECQERNLKNVVLDTLNFYQVPLYVVVNGLKDGSDVEKPFIRFNVITEKTCWTNICYGFQGKNSFGIVIITGGFTEDKKATTEISTGGFVYMPVDEFVVSNDVKTALTILENLKY